MRVEQVTNNEFQAKEYIQQNNAPSRSAKLTHLNLKKKTFKGTRLIEFPSPFPDINPTEKRSIIKRYLYEHGKRYSSKGL